jgi:hypothetical protein
LRLCRSFMVAATPRTLAATVASSEEAARMASLDVRPGGGGHLPPSADAGPAVVSDNQPQ